MFFIPDDDNFNLINMFQYGSLLNLCVEAVNQFNAENQSVEDHIKSFLKRQNLSILTDDDSTFIVEVFCGCVHYNKFLSIAVDSFYENEGKTCLHKEKNVYKVISRILNGII